MFARAEEDELDDVVDIEGEDNQVVGDDALDDDGVKSSQDVDTTILFTKPFTILGDIAFGKYFSVSRGWVVSDYYYILFTKKSSKPACQITHRTYTHAD